MEPLRARDAVATIARNVLSRSDSANARISSVIFPAFAHACTVSVASRATTWRRAPVSMSPPILGSPTFPAPTTRHRLPSSFINIGNKLLTISPVRLSLPLHSARVPRADRERLPPRTLLPENSADPCLCDEQKSAADFHHRCRPRDTDATTARLPQEPQWPRSDSPQALRLTDAGRAPRPGRSNTHLPSAR